VARACVGKCEYGDASSRTHTYAHARTRHYQRYLQRLNRLSRHYVHQGDVVPRLLGRQGQVCPPHPHLPALQIPFSPIRTPIPPVHISLSNPPSCANPAKHSEAFCLASLCINYTCAPSQYVSPTPLLHTPPIRPPPSSTNSHMGPCR
jgi:hypothetical protein